MEKYLAYMDYFQHIMNSHLSLVESFVSDKEIQDVAMQYQNNQEAFIDNQFNIFTIVSDLYYRENFHSDIIKELLDPLGSHRQGTVFLYAFIDFLNDNFKNVSISKMDYSSIKVEREASNIDILIKSEESQHCIIIENKIHNAGDTHRQLPRYYDTMKKDGYEVDAIVYLPLNKDKQPNQSDWNELDKEHINPLLCIVPAYQKNDTCLVESWLIPCSTKTNNIDCISILRQYSELIKLLSHNNMDNVILEKFYSSLLEEDNYKTACSVRNMLNDLPCYMKDRLMDEFRKKEDIDEVWTWNGHPSHCGLRFYDKKQVEYKVDIWTTDELGYKIQVFAQNQPALRQTSLLSAFTLTQNNRWEKGGYSFFDEAKIIKEAYDIFQDMKTRVSSGLEMFQSEQ